MNKFLSSLLFCIGFILPIYAQKTMSLGFKIDARIDTVARYELKNIGENRIAIQMPFGRHQILNPMIEKNLIGKEVHLVELVYTDYPKGADLIRLNKRRMAALYMLNPEMFEDDRVEWRLVIQNGFRNAQQANRLFHGFVVHFRPPAAPRTTIAQETKTFESVIKGKIKPKDSTILKIFDRQDKWDKMLIVSDLTGSMSPYVGQLLLWVQLNFAKKTVKQFVFFNDGDDKKTIEKEIGTTGGIYNIKADSLDAVIKVAKKTMENGNGGDGAENNIEALLKGIAICPDCKEIVMIADNWAPVRDMELLPKLKRPIKIILCGDTFAFINPDYLDIARATNGSVHTMKHDLKDLVKINEGETIRFGEHSFQVRDGKFVQLTN